MPTLHPPPTTSSPSRWSRSEVQDLLHSAQALKRSARLGGAPPVLRGRYLAVLCDNDGGSPAELFERNAHALGARVSRLPCAAAIAAADDPSNGLARVLSRLYHAIECQGAPREVVRAIERSATVPVWDGLATRYVPAQVLADLLSMQEHRRRPFESMRLGLPAERLAAPVEALRDAASVLGIRLEPPDDAAGCDFRYLGIADEDHVRLAAEGDDGGDA